MQLSVIIPVYNQWPLTRACLESLGATLRGDFFEVFVVDNASSDATVEECEPLGSSLFGARFHYVRFEENRNFGPANNHAARMARGEYLLLLNNDIVLTPGWYEPLLEDFQEFPGIAATGPILLFPQEGYLGHTVQHLGVHLTPQRRVNHLYIGMPAACPLTRKRRFFQMITAACMMIPRTLFLENGGFDEFYVNGFEDVDLCARLHSQGWRFTVNPGPRVYHHTSQTPGRSDNEYRNAIHLNNTNAKLLHPDLPKLLADDGLLYRITPWLTWEILLPGEEAARLEPFLRVDNPDEMRGIMMENALWNEGYLHLVDLLLRKGDLYAAMQVWESIIKLFPRPENTVAVLSYIYEQDNRLLLRDHVDYSLSFCNTLLAYDEGCREGLRTLPEERDDAALLRDQLESWQRRRDEVFQECMKPFFRALATLLRHDAIPLSRPNAYLLWKLAGQDEYHDRIYGAGRNSSLPSHSGHSSPHVLFPDSDHRFPCRAFPFRRGLVPGSDA